MPMMKCKPVVNEAKKRIRERNALPSNTGSTYEQPAENVFETTWNQEKWK